MRTSSEINIPVFAAYPIMLVDTHALPPALGYVFNPVWLDPQESIVSMLWKFARMNLIAGHLIAAQLSRTVVNPYEGINPSSNEVNIRRVHQMLCLPSKQIRNALLPDALGCSDFRYCSRCMRGGSHSVVHQIALVTHCPIRGNSLQNVCGHCNSKMPYRLNAILLDAPFRCGYCRRYYGTAASSPRCLRYSTGCAINYGVSSRKQVFRQGLLMLDIAGPLCHPICRII